MCPGGRAPPPLAVSPFFSPKAERVVPSCGEVTSAARTEQDQAGTGPGPSLDWAWTEPGPSLGRTETGPVPSLDRAWACTYLADDPTGQFEKTEGPRGRPWEARGRKGSGGSGAPTTVWGARLRSHGNSRGVTSKEQGHLIPRFRFLLGRARLSTCPRCGRCPLSPQRRLSLLRGSFVCLCDLVQFIFLVSPWCGTSGGGPGTPGTRRGLPPPLWTPTLRCGKTAPAGRDVTVCL